MSYPLSKAINVVTQYHVFTHGHDDWYDDLFEAKKLYREWAKEYGSARIYIETYVGGEFPR
jgi:hypothetical protein